ESVELPDLAPVEQNGVNGDAKDADHEVESTVNNSISVNANTSTKLQVQSQRTKVRPKAKSPIIPGGGENGKTLRIQPIAAQPLIDKEVKGKTEARAPLAKVSTQSQTKTTIKSATTP